MHVHVHVRVLWQCCKIQLRFTCAPSLCSVACSHLPNSPCPPTHLSTHTRCQHTNRTCGTPHPTQVSRSLSLPTLPPSLPPFPIFGCTLPFQSSSLSPYCTLLSSLPFPFSLSISLSLFGMSLLPELPHATFVMCLGRGVALSMCGV